MQSSVHLTESLLFLTLLQLLVMIAAARAGNQLFRRFGQPGVVGEITAGLILGPSLLGQLWPGAWSYLFAGPASTPITLISQIGLVLLMFQIGTDFESAQLAQPRNRSAMLGIAAASILVPFLFGVAIARYSSGFVAPGIAPVPYSLFLGVGLAITAVPVLGRILREFDLGRTQVGIVALGAAALNDVIGWLLLAGISAYAAARFAIRDVLIQVTGLALLVLAARLAVRPLIDRLLVRMPIRNRQLPPNLMVVVICVIFVMAMCTYQLSIFAIFGGFLAGVLFHHNREFVAAWREQVGQFVTIFFLPAFFTYTGLRTNILGLHAAADGEWLALVLGAAVLGKVLPVYLTGRLFGFQHRESLMLGSLMNTRGLMELIVLNIGYDSGFLPQKMFTILVIMAVVTTLMTGPLLRRLMARTGHIVPAGIEA